MCDFGGALCENSNVILDKLVENISSDNILYNINEYVPNKQYDVVLVKCLSSSNDNEEKLDRTKYVMGNHGIAYVLVPTAVLFSKNFKRNREYIVNEFQIKGVITLKTSVFDFSSIPLSLILLENNKAMKQPGLLLLVVFRK
ncbi:N-6 DNA methylase [Oceanobacillus sp. 143]|nr:N-6 DNA methylase [Oceanobacillus sp. 143]